MVATRRSKVDVGPEEGNVEVTVATDGNLDDDVAAAAAADTAEAIANTEADDSDEGIRPAFFEQTTTTVVTEEGPGEFTIETVQNVTPVEDDNAANAAILAEEAAVPEEAVADAIQETVEAATTAAEETGEPAVAQTTVEAEPAAQDQRESPGDGDPEDQNGIQAEEAEDVGQGQNVADEEQPSPSKGSIAYRLFVGCLPHQFKEEELRPYFEEVAPVREIMILRDQLSGSSRGCAFAVYDSKADAEQAIEKLNKKITLPGSSQPLEVRFARESNKIQPASEPNEKNQLFYARAPATATESDVQAVFAEYGEVTEVALFQNKAAGVSKGCGFVFYKDRTAAEAAINALHDKVTMPGGFMPLTVKWADPNLNEKKRKAAEDAMDPNKDNTQVFFARIPKDVSEDAIKEVFAKAGSVKEVVLFKTHQSATNNKGCGIVTMQTHEDASRVLEQLDNTYTFDGMDIAMVLKWVDQDLQKRRRMERDGPPGGPGGFGGPHSGGWQGRRMGGGQFGGPALGGHGSGFQEEERPPAGCDRDAFKLYLAGIPRSWELQDLRKVVEKFGQIVDMNLVRDKVTKEPKGVAFMWYKSRASAEQAIGELNNQSFDDGRGGKRIIQISKAKPRRTLPMGPGGYGAPPPTAGGYRGYGRPPGGGGVYQVDFPGARPLQQASYQQQPPAYYQQPLPAYDPYAAAAPPQQPASYGGYQGTYQQQQPAYGYQAQTAQAPLSYQQQHSTASAYQQPASAYQQPAAATYQQSAAATYQQPVYNPPAAQATGYGTAQAGAPAYGTSGYDAQAQQQPAYGATQYGAAAASMPNQGGYNYSVASGGTPQSGYTATAQQPAGSAPSAQYSYAAAPQTYTDPNAGGYNYGAPTG